jgi:hypothetical protein
MSKKKSAQTNADIFLSASRKYAQLTLAEIKIFEPIVKAVAQGKLGKQELIAASRAKELDPRFDNLRERRPDEISTAAMSPLGLALSFLFNNFNRIYRADIE